ncbi:hypothetical protein [Tenacibaculum aquimarinum]|uniref:hypothetical protein n=1 Tax=Tenacibaculum aquimarinum TaxID=2910675 RepID=UPI001F0A9DF8|nr:hypothetical protein [Tenacibaculum aquimarinum]MCH3883189.1 hypothetical protein [Tenacibaculum aquimarinum]
MKNFIIKSILFFIIPIIIYTGIFYFLRLNFKNELSQYPIILLGDSQTEFISDERILNKSIGGSPFFVHSQFSEDFIEQLRGKKVFIACNYHNLSKLYQNRLENDQLYPGWKSSMYSHLDDYQILNRKHINIIPKNLDRSLFNIKNLPNFIYERHLKFKSKNSLKSINNDTLSISKAIQRHWNHPDYILNDSIQITYLKKLITELNKNNCEVVLLKMPLTNYYINNVPNDIKSKLNELSNNQNVRILDLNKELSISKEYKYFKDYGHLNKLGDSLVMEYLKKYE